MSTELICAIVAAAGTVFSAIVAWFVSRSTASKEIEKMKLAWEHEDVVSSDAEFAEMSAAVAKYVHYNSQRNLSNAMELVAAIRSKEIGPIADALDHLYSSIRNNERELANSLLTEVIEEKRKAKSKAYASNGRKPEK